MNSRDSERTRAAIIEWMNGTMEIKGWTPNHWAERAGTTPTNVTRFLNGSDFIPSTRTLNKLAEAAGVVPPMMGRMPHPTAGSMVPLLTAPQLLQGTTTSKVLVASNTPQRGAFAYEMKTDHMMGAAVLPGDRLICVPPRDAIVPGAVVLATAGSNLKVRIYLPPYLLAKPIGPPAPAFPLADAKIIGVAVELHRAL